MSFSARIFMYSEGSCKSESYLVIFSLSSGYQPILTKFSANVAYFSKLNLTFLPKIMNELISDICSEVIKILLDTCK